MKKVLQISFWVILFVGLLAIFGFAISEQKRVPCAGIIVEIEDGNEHGFISEADVLRLIKEHFKNIETLQIDSINTGIIEAALKKNPYIREVNVYKSIAGQIRVELKRSSAFVRVINQQGEGFYIGTDGEILPLCSSFIPHTLLASGHIAERCDPEERKVLDINKQNRAEANLLENIFYLAKKIGEHPILNSAIAQIYVNSKGEFELVPVSGGHIIELGIVENLDLKFENLLAFYQAGSHRLDEKSYRIIDLRFNDQVVCKK
jgi:cell division protein FtsQ